MKLPRHLRKLLAALGGGIIVLIGILLLVLPGPGILVIALGLFVLSLEFAWAEKYYKKLEKEAKKGLAKIRGMLRK